MAHPPEPPLSGLQIPRYKHQKTALKDGFFNVGRATASNMEQKSAINYEFFLSHLDELIAIKETTHQLWLMMKTAQKEIAHRQ